VHAADCRARCSDLTEAPGILGYRAWAMLGEPIRVRCPGQLGIVSIRGRPRLEVVAPPRKSLHRSSGNVRSYSECPYAATQDIDVRSWSDGRSLS